MTDPKQMGPLGSDVTASDHYFQSGGLFGAPGTAPPFESNVAEVTLPGSTCPGERTLFAAHPDSTPGLNTHNGSAGCPHLKKSSKRWEHPVSAPRTYAVGCMSLGREQTTSLKAHSTRSVYTA